MGKKTIDFIFFTDLLGFGVHGQSVKRMCGRPYGSDVRGLWAWVGNLPCRNVWWKVNVEFKILFMEISILLIHVKEMYGFQLLNFHSLMECDRSLIGIYWYQGSITIELLFFAKCFYVRK
jgi:hypothetical protein